MLYKQTLYGLDDVTIIPAATSNINHRSECNCLYNDNMLPIFTAPMPCVIDDKSSNIYKLNGINTIMPRSEDIKKRLKNVTSMWVAFSLNEFYEYFINSIYETDNNTPLRILIDIANGNMEYMINGVSKAKKIYRNKIELMVGNIANPQTFNALADAGADYIRCGIGGGAGCITSTSLGIHYPMASLIFECFTINTTRKHQKLNAPKIIADGGISNYRQIIKCLALGADYVMLGSLLNKCEDSAGEIVQFPSTSDGVKTFKKVYYGMASSKGQQTLGKDGKATPEGKIVYNDMNPPIAHFTKELKDYIRSAMSYCNCHVLEEFIGNVDMMVMTPLAAKQFNQSRK